MNKFIGIALLLMFGLVLAAETQAQTRSQLRTMVSRAESITGDRFSFEATTPNGARVYGVSRPTNQMLRAIDDGLADLFAVARKNNYNRRLSYAEYTVFIARPDRTKNADGNYSPDFAIGAAQYAGTEYDKGGYIYAAGMVSSFNPMSFIIAEHARDFNRVAEVVRYEGEHLVLYHNDHRRFEETRDHSQGGGHPILN